MPAEKGNKYAVGNKGGRPSEYKPEYAHQAKKLTLLGVTNKEMADFFNVSEAAIERWKKKHEEFRRAITLGKMGADAKVAARMFQRAIGYEHEAEEIKVVAGPRGEGSEVVRVPVKKMYPPDTTAGMWWLQNRRGQNWRMKQEIDINKHLDNLSNEDLERVVTLILEKSNLNNK